MNVGAPPDHAPLWDLYPLMQFTGLLDKTGKEIYEGDIVTFLQGTQHETSKVFFKEGCFSVRARLNDPDYIPCLGIIDLRRCKVIGNIYEHPELLSK